MFLVYILLFCAIDLVETFEVVWNAPTQVCAQKHGVQIPLDTFGIKFNSNQSWYGEEVVLFYENRLGSYPHVKWRNSTNFELINGGIPQDVDLDQHLRKTEEDIKKAIPDPDFPGLAVIDWESWRPLWDLNWGRMRIYQKISRARVRKQYPRLKSKLLINKLARKQFEKAARPYVVLTLQFFARSSPASFLALTTGMAWNTENFVRNVAGKNILVKLGSVHLHKRAQRTLMLSTLRLGKKLRPMGKWGFYLYPNCYGGQPINGSCGATTRKANTRLSWLFDEVTAFFPSVYVTAHKKSNHLSIQAKLKEALAFGRMRSSLAVFVYAKFSYNEYEEDLEFLDEEDLSSSVKQVADFGFDGVVFWSSSKSESSGKKCKSISHYVTSTLGPYVSNLVGSVE